MILSLNILWFITLKLKMFEKDGTAAIIKDIHQLNDLNVIKPIKTKAFISAKHSFNGRLILSFCPHPITLALPGDDAPCLISFTTLASALDILLP